MKKRMLCLLVLCMLLTALVGCGKQSGKNYTERPTAESTKPATVTEKPAIPTETPTAEPTKPTGGEPTAEPTQPAGGEPTAEPTKPAGDEPESGRTEFSEGTDFALKFSTGGGISLDLGAPSEKPSSLPVENQSYADQTGTPVQLTIEDIQAMNGDSLVIDIYSNDGYLSTLIGKFYEGQVLNAEDGVESVKGLASLLGLTKGCEFFAVYREKDNNNYTYYTYQQRYGINTLQYATLRIVVDPDGYTAGLTCSFAPNIGTASQETAITAAQAEQFITQGFGSAYTVMQGKTVKMAVQFNSVVYNCWIVYTNNPSASANFDMPYLANYVSTDGVYLMSMPANSFAQSNKEVMNNDAYFDGLVTQDVNFSIAMPSGGTKQITVPIAQNPKDGKFYLMDPSRKIAVAQYNDFYYKGSLNFVSSASRTDGWPDNNLMAYYNYINAYDFYADHGIRSVDGFETPILITVGYCDQQGNPVDNACYYGVNEGWVCFAASDANKYSYCADVCGHEFTHGVTSNSMQGIFYQNETGAINEAYSDIMGNLCEKITGETSDTGWMIAENSGDGQMRNMADPNSYEQPAFVGDMYYVPAVLAPSDYNDNGGVHLNNTLVSRLAYLLDRDGMSLELQFRMWITSIELLTPKSNYEDLHAILLASLKINGLLQQYGPTVNKAFAEEGLNDDWNSSYLEATKSGCGRLNFQVDGYISSKPAVCYFYTTEGEYVTGGYPDKNGIVSVLLPAGSYLCIFYYAEEDLNNPVVTFFDGSRWTSTQTYGAFSVQNGGVTTLPVLNSGKSATAGTDGSGDTGDTGDTGDSGDTGDTGDNGNTSRQGEKLNLVSYNGGYFTMLIPEGWRVDVSGSYGSICYRIYDPNMPSRQAFFYGALAPFHKSEASRKYLSYYDTTGGILSNGPVLTSADVRGITDCWQYCIDFQIRYDGKQLFPTMNNIQLAQVETYQGPYSGYGPETVGVGTFYDASGNGCILGIAGALVDLDFYGYYGGNWFYTCYGLMGVSSPYTEFDDCYEDLLTCVCSIQFSQDYILASQYSSMPLLDNEEIKANFEMVSGAIDKLYQKVK